MRQFLFKFALEAQFKNKYHQHIETVELGQNNENFRHQSSIVYCIVLS